MNPQRPSCPVCNGRGVLPAGVNVERIDAPTSNPLPLSGVNLVFEGEEEPKYVGSGTARVETNRTTLADAGVMPREFWLKERALHLMRALTEYIVTSRIPNPQWSDELADIVSELAHT